MSLHPQTSEGSRLYISGYHFIFKNGRWVEVHELPRIYISGPMTGFVDFNREAFSIAERNLRNVGWSTVNPSRNSPAGVNTDAENAEYRGYMLAGIRGLLTCDAIFLLRGWENSQGSMAEYSMAAACGIQRYYESDCESSYTMHIAEKFDANDGVKMSLCDFFPKPSFGVKGGAK